MELDELINWGPDFHHDGLLYFVQRINEMLDQQTCHLYRAPVRNTYSLISEFLVTADLVNQKIISPNELNIIMEEFLDSFSSDEIIKANLGEEMIDRICCELKAQKNRPDQMRIMNTLRQSLFDYSDWCKVYIKKVVQDGEPSKIDFALRCFIPALINSGYSREFIYQFNADKFSKTAVTSLSVLDEFLDRFDFRMHKYSVIVVLDSNAGVFQEILERSLNFEFISQDEVCGLNCDRNKYILLKTSDVDAGDEYNAAQVAVDRLGSFLRYYTFFREKKENWLFEKCIVLEENGTSLIIPNLSNNIVLGEGISPQFAANISYGIIMRLSWNASEESMVTINNAVAIHNNSALEVTDLNNAFLNLWSAFEILFGLPETNVNVEKQSKVVSKITEIEKKALPILVGNYISFTMFNELRLNVVKYVPAAELEKLRGKINSSVDEWWFAYLIVLDEYQEERDTLRNLLRNYPLLQARLDRIHDIYSSKQAIIDEMDRYSKRIKWHLRRLYRTRNGIVHSGEKYKRVRDLCEHLHSYVDECLIVIMQLLGYNPDLHSIDDVLINIDLKKEEITALLKEDGDVDEEALKKILKFLM